MEPAVPFALLGGVVLLAVAAWVGLAAAALARSRVRAVARGPAQILTVGALVLALVETVTATRFGEPSSELLLLARGGGLLLLGAGLYAGALSRHATAGPATAPKDAVPRVPLRAATPPPVAGVVVPLAAAPGPAVLAALAGLLAVAGALRARRDGPGMLLAGGLLLATGAAALAPVADEATGALAVILLRGASALLLLAALVVFAQASLLGKVVAAILAGVLAMATAAVGVVGTVVANGYDREQASLVSEAAEGRLVLLDQTLDNARVVAALAAEACNQRPASCTEILKQLSPPGLSTFAVRVPVEGTAQSLGGSAPLDPAQVVALASGSAVMTALDGRLGQVPAAGLQTKARLVGKEPGIALIVVVPSGRATPESDPTSAFVYGVRLDKRYADRDFQSGDFRFSLLVDEQIVSSNLFERERLQLERIAARARIANGVPDGGITVPAEGSSPTVHFRTVLALDGTPVGTLALSRDAQAALDAQQGALRALLVTALITTALVGGLALLLGRRTVEPVRRLTIAARRMAAGDLTVTTGVGGRDEVGTLSRTFDAMSGSVSRLTGDLRASAARLETVLSSMSDGLVATDAAGRVTSINRAALAMAGLDSADDALGQPFAEVLDVCVGAEPLALDARDRPDVAAEVRRRDGVTVPVSAALAPLDDGRGVVLVLRDTTQEREVERMKTEFLSNVSHELRTPLTPIRGYAEILVAKPGMSADKVELFAATIRDASIKMNRVVDLLVDVAAIEAGRVSVQPRAVAPAALVDGRLADWRTRAPERAADLKRRVAARLPEVHVDPDWLDKALDELVDNAIKYTPPGTAITLTAALTEDGRRVRVAVRDAGPGIAAGDQEGLFTSFEQVDGSATRRVGGLGLGLSFVRRLAQDTGLPLTVVSSLGKGAEFALDLPFADPPFPPSPRRPTKSRLSR
ncbi:MAG: HAMP domain-containing protein [Actinobacteria bacterium]|nr:HAMP domain-containing protein [Actinomycetota bacterium]MBW3647050.1 HAMP domain-containing protein [Actinomycetota bacterium]